MGNESPGPQDDDKQRGRMQCGISGQRQQQQIEKGRGNGHQQDTDLVKRSGQQHIIYGMVMRRS